MTITCEIEFEKNPSKIVYTGQLLRGKVHLLLTETISVRNISLKIFGEAYSRWKEGFSDNETTHTGRENYLNDRIYLVGGQEGEVHLTPGSYDYPFQYMLPSALPTSFEGRSGHIRYTACVVVGNLLWPKKRFDVEFTVIKSLDLNSVPGLREPVIVKEHKTFSPCCLLCCFQSTPLDITACMPMGGYTPGQTIELQIEVNNKSGQPVSNFKLQIIKQIRYYINARNRIDYTRETIVMSEEETRGCDSKSDANIRVDIVVPSILPTDIEISNIIKVEHSLRIIGSVVGCHINPTLILPIVIGSIPLDNPWIASMKSHQEMNYMPSTAMHTNGIILQQPIGNMSNSHAASPSVPYPNEIPSIAKDIPHSKTAKE